ncbi:hypothetical protein Back11_57970 [Paenibacillus baekrokdamisoli]|uniref:Uncharacterized protein n=1 Tax=Paenibacillus baekrokdamisoli TaxID=1712516 RepID=A0A3G9J1L1_9BACL|nr:hypothetical protein [Paenibacillus baekrokdamisoli]BBH24452.1 hypothetical protein Back11_57970 [Paenibacillus baekrokdamisoli]
MSTTFILETSSDYLTSRAGLILVGQLLAETHLNKRLNLSSGWWHQRSNDFSR